jgi:hypothetical protein
VGFLKDAGVPFGTTKNREAGEPVDSELCE